MRLPLSIAILSLSGATVTAQLPSPNPIPRVAPRAHWAVPAGVTAHPVTRTSNHGAASADKMYVFGGRLGNNTSTVLNDLHEFDGVSWTVKNADGAAGAPPRRGRAGTAWNHATNRLVVFGGEDGAGTLLNDIWEWDPGTNAWTDVTPAAGPAPSPRRWTALAWDPTTNGMIVFGGRDTSQDLSDTWLFLSGAWVQIVPANSPPARRQHSLMARPDFGDVVLCGGQDTNVSPSEKRFDIWTWNGGNWTEIIPTTTAVPAASVANQAVYDSLRKRVVMQGGNGHSAFGGAGQYGTEYGGSPTDWTSEFDCITNEWLLYGGASFNSNDPVIGRTSRYFAAFVPALGKVYKVSGQPAAISDTYEYQATPVAAAASVGTGCAGVMMVAETDPWLGRDFEFTVTGLQPVSVVATFVGFALHGAPIPITPIPFPGCATLMVMEVASFPLANAGGTASGVLPIPADPTILSLTPYLHSVQIETAGPSITNVSSSNALGLTLGSL